MLGRVVKILPRIHYVQTDSALFKCKARGKMRLEKQKALVGDLVEIEPDPLEEDVARIRNVIDRKNFLKRPEVANIDNLVITFAMEMPSPNLGLLDRLLMQAEKKKIHPVICFNKADLTDDRVRVKIGEIYSQTPYKLIFISAEQDPSATGRELMGILKEGVNVFAGPSGVGKSTLINLLIPEAEMRTGEISDKLKRGKHTTRHSELIYLGNQIFLCDTPGFTGYENESAEIRDIQEFMPDLLLHAEGCKFRDCLHKNEPDCAVLAAVEEGKIARERYASYLQFLEEASESKKKKY